MRSLPEIAVERWFPTDSLRRLCCSLILAEQADLVARGTMAREAMLPLHTPDLSVAARDALRVDEDGLGFDSLARLSLILRFNRFFNLSETGIEDYLLIHPCLGDWVSLIAQHLRLVANRAQFTFATSGSAGPVKHITHSATVLISEMLAQRSGPLAHISQGARILSLVPPHHIFGLLFTCLLPSTLQSEVVDLHLAGPTAVFRHARPGDLIIGTPFNWQTLNTAQLTFPKGVFGVTSAGPSTSATWGVRQVNRLAGLTEIYGSTETGGLGWRTDPDAPFQLLSHLTQHGGLVLDPMRDPQTLDVQDRIDWLSQDQFRLLGRKDDVVQVGGVNVSPDTVIAAIRRLADVADVAVRPDAGRIKAFVVPAAAITDLTAFDLQVRAHITRTLPAPARPVSLTFGPAVPRNAMGKLCDWDSRPGCR